MLKLLLAFLISISAQAAQPGAVPSVTVSANGANTANVSITPTQLTSGCGGSGSSGCFSLYAFTSSGVSANFFHPLYGGPGTAGTYSGPGQLYRVTTGKTAWCFDITAGATTATSTFQLVYATGTFTAGGSGSVPTGAVFQGGATQFYPLVAGATASVPAVIPGVYSVPATDYFGFQNATASSSYFIHMDCFEQ